MRYTKKTSDGFLMERTESTAYKGLQKIYFLTEIINRSGSWQIEGSPPKKIINAKYLLNNELVKDKIYGEKSKNDFLWFIDEDNILVEENFENTNNRSIIKLIVKLKENIYEQLLGLKNQEKDEIFSKQIELTTKKYKAQDKNYKSSGMLDVAATTPYICEICFDKENKKIIRIKKYNKEGIVISNLNITNIVYNIPIDDNLFEIPKKPIPLRASTWEEFLMISDK